MPTQVIMPQLGESVDEGTISKWLKDIGLWLLSHLCGDAEYIKCFEHCLFEIFDPLNDEKRERLNNLAADGLDLMGSVPSMPEVVLENWTVG